MPQHNFPALRTICSHLPRHLGGSSRHLCRAGSCSKALEAPSLAQGAEATDRTTSLCSSPGPGSPPNIHLNAPWHPASPDLAPCKQDPVPGP